MKRFGGLDGVIEKGGGLISGKDDVIGGWGGIDDEGDFWPAPTGGKDGV